MREKKLKLNFGESVVWIPPSNRTRPTSADGNVGNMTLLMGLRCQVDVYSNFQPISDETQCSACFGVAILLHRRHATPRRDSLIFFLNCRRVAAAQSPSTLEVPAMTQWHTPHLSPPHHDSSRMGFPCWEAFTISVVKASPNTIIPTISNPLFQTGPPSVQPPTFQHHIPSGMRT